MRMPAIFWSEQRFYAKFFSLDAKYQQLKRQCHEIFDISLLKRFDPGPNMNRRKQFCKLFCFREDIRSQRLKISCLCSKRAIGFVNTPKYIFSPDCSFKICEKPSSFQKCPRSRRLRRHRVCLVKDYADAQFSKIRNYIYI